jgi:hypothetical protein
MNHDSSKIRKLNIHQSVIYDTPRIINGVKLYHYKKGFLGSFEKESDAEQLMKEIGGVFQWNNPNFDLYNRK